MPMVVSSGSGRPIDCSRASVRAPPDRWRHQIAMTGRLQWNRHLTHYSRTTPRSASLRLSRLSGDLSPATKPQLFEDIVDVILDRRRTHAEGPGNLLIRQTLRYERDNVIFTTSQLEVTVVSFSHDCTIRPALLSRQRGYVSKKRTGQPLGADEIAANSLMEDIDHLLRRTFPRDVRYNPSFSTGYDFFIDFADGESDDLAVRHDVADPSRERANIDGRGI
jgi:hypothetical protein